MRDPYVAILEQRTWFDLAGRRTVDRLLAEQMALGAALSFDVYRPARRGCRFTGRAPFWSPHRVHRTDTRETQLSAALRRLRRPDEAVFARVQAYLNDRIAGRHPRSGFETYALWELAGLRRAFSRAGAQHLASVLDRNLFSHDVPEGDLRPPPLWDGYLFTLRFHIHDHFVPPGKTDLSRSHGGSVYLAAYSSSFNKTRLYKCQRGEPRILGDIPNEPCLATKAAALLDRPEIEADVHGDRLRLEVRSGQLLGAVHLFAERRGALEQVWSLTGQSIDEGRQRHLSHYEEIDGGFVAQARVPAESEGFTLYAFDANDQGQVCALP